MQLTAKQKKFLRKAKKHGAAFLNFFNTTFISALLAVYIIVELLK